ncbi:hypothetical protein [Streptomyces sp. NPDC001135]
MDEMFGAAAGNEVLVRDGHGRRFRLSPREVLASGRAAAIPERFGPHSDDDRETASVVLAQLTDAQLDEVRERTAHMNEVVYGYRSGSPELPAPGEPRLEYAATVPKMQRYKTKADELGVSVRTIKRWVHDFHLDQAAGLAHGAFVVRAQEHLQQITRFDYALGAHQCQPIDVPQCHDGAALASVVSA